MNGFSRFRVVINSEQQYSIWPEDKALPQGWVAEGFVGDKENCLSHISLVWKDIRPKTLKESLTAN